MTVRERRCIDKEEYKKILVNLMIKIDYLCQLHGLNYQLAYGTLLGAVRHKGFIPWDDDVDIFMPREDYKKLQNLINKCDCGMKFISIDNEPNTIYPYGKVCDTNTVAYEIGFKHVPGYGAFIDVFPLDYVPKSSIKRKFIYYRYNILIKIIQHTSRTRYSRSKSIPRSIIALFAFLFTRLFDTGSLIRFFDKNIQQLSSGNSENYYSVPWGSKGKAYTQSEINNVCRMEFENRLFNVSIEYDKILKTMYGDYMKLPPIEKRVNPHSIECFYK